MQSGVPTRPPHWVPRSVPDLPPRVRSGTRTLDVGAALIGLGLIVFAANLLQPCELNCMAAGPILTLPYVIALGLIAAGNAVVAVAWFGRRPIGAQPSRLSGIVTRLAASLILVGFVNLAGLWFLDRTFPATASPGVSAVVEAWAFAGLAGLLLAGAGDAVIVLGSRVPMRL